MDTVKKQPFEQYPWAMEFYGKLPPRTNLLSGTVHAVNVVIDQEDDSVLGSTTLDIQGTQAIATLKSGVSGTSYKVTYRVTCSDGSKLEDEILLVVDEV
jgi:methionine-rich copper-binding protein CopC